ncbi:DEAD/DEAH box helicase [Enterobacter hormaechei]|uniref:DEAD/DEAH box helicase n=1 Tax=Enterobacteriaceae TaxID=543 RepID=UPI001E3E68A8|nr:MULTISPECIES: DEAD/DEAH box helicase [Enterobacteriaceae]ELQ3561707.1 DEAD/DEAH box helicase [Enterobacter hormaechei]HAS1731257.1 DEAD/DEAH box helicase [Enterobacter cloacae]HCB1638254.1 DEAD/DEAH box helicase [Citrobacter freundii]EMB8466179.1 DEAD/DEAH box helicase [Enterobacter hormaechei]MDM2718874.1 DEAD/DEAH box helicase [Citrobacter sp. Cy232]
MNHWLLDAIADKRSLALRKADRVQFYSEMTQAAPTFDIQTIQEVAAALELAVLDMELDRFADDEASRKVMRRTAEDAFRLLRIQPLPEAPMEAATQLLRASALAVIGDRGADAARWLRALEDDQTSPTLPLDSADWGERCWAVLTDIWLRLVRKKGWSDRDTVLERVAALRDAQQTFERNYLGSFAPLAAKRSALELIAIYHLTKAADVLAHYITDGVVEDSYQIQPVLDSHFDRAVAACDTGQLLELGPLTRLLARAAAQMVENSLWTVTRAVNSRVTRFVRELVSRGRGDRALFDVLPPQRRTLAECGLLGSSRRAVVVSLPTSSGKTLIAQFRMLQALNQFDDQKGWVAYLAPSRALVNQITRQLRRDFQPLGVVVERVSPALEVNGIEAGLLADSQDDTQFRVLVATPEKFDLMMRQSWEEKIGRPLTLVVVDEAHTIQDKERGLRLELLLATINRECREAQFLLLTPFIENAREVARWLGGQNSDDISLGVDWQPNDRAIGIVSPLDAGALKGKSRDYHLSFQAVHTSRPSIRLDEDFSLGKEEALAVSLSKAKDIGTLAAMTARKLSRRGPVIVMHSRPDYVWKLAEKLKGNCSETLPDDVRFVQSYVAAELGAEFPLVALLAHRIGVHHGGLPEEVRMLMEWLFEKGHLNALAATTTLAQGVNFPVSGVVMAATQYPFGQDMPPEDFWNIAGRAGRVSQGQLGVVALVAKDESEVAQKREFINRNTGDLNSALIQIAQAAADGLEDLGLIVYRHPEWSSFLQYLAHTYRQMGQPSNFADQIEQVLRGTFGFEKLRTSDSQIARRLLNGIHRYVDYLASPSQPLKLVDSTGFSLQSIRTVLTHKGDLGPDSWNRERLFSSGDNTLKNMMGVLLRVPELRDNLNSVLGGRSPDGDKLACILKDWVNGEDIAHIAKQYFSEDGADAVTALTKCGQNLFGKLTHTTSWGLNALLAITTAELDDDERSRLSNLPSQVYYGVATDEAVSLRLLGVPRRAAPRLAEALRLTREDSLPAIRQRLENLPEQVWSEALGKEGTVYRKAWMIMDGEQ